MIRQRSVTSLYAFLDVSPQYLSPLLRGGRASQQKARTRELPEAYR